METVKAGTAEAREARGVASVGMEIRVDPGQREGSGVQGGAGERRQRPHRASMRRAGVALAASAVLAAMVVALAAVLPSGSALVEAGPDSVEVVGYDRHWEGAVPGAGGRRLLMLNTSLLVAGLGDGLFSLVVLYIVLALTCFIGCRIDNAWVVYVPMFLVILIITLILVLAPKVPKEELARQQADNALRVVDQNYIPQTTIIVAVFAGAVVGVVLLVCCHCIQPVYVRSLDD